MIESTSATGVTGDSATLRAKVSPNGFESSYWFEYGLEDCALGGCTKVPLIPVGIGAGRKGVKVSQALTGLAANTTYHYRVVGENEWGEKPGADKTLITQTSGLGFALGDGRVWEMVSPPRQARRHDHLHPDDRDPGGGLRRPPRLCDPGLDRRGPREL